MRTRQIFSGGTVISIGAGGTQVFHAGVGDMVIGSGKGIVQSRELTGSFDSLEVTGSAGIDVRRGDRCTIEVHGEDNVVDFLETELVGSTLQVGIKRGVNFTSHLPLKVVATAPAVSEVDLSGSGDVRLSGLDQDELRVELRGSGDVVADGRVSIVSLALQGSGDIDTRRLQARKATIKLHGSGDVRAYASEEAKVRLHGSGDVTVKGRPKVRDSKVAGSGDIDFDD
ncbi:MAG: DUF2807 domain-containing protein [Burkholderiales bacterium]|jgi:hypothetical protein|nr:DUF2807 domain-containing protein [Burkholderiaceae bacterium]RTL19185.1 MAG: DUF2807 domain-containing protein [Burkholderiales bacterium]